MTGRKREKTMTAEERKKLLEKANKANKRGAEWLSDDFEKADFEDIVGQDLTIKNLYLVNKDTDEKHQHYYLVEFNEFPKKCFGTPTFLTNVLDNLGEDSKRLTFVPMEKENIGGGKTYRTFTIK